MLKQIPAIALWMSISVAALAASVSCSEDPGRPLDATLAYTTVPSVESDSHWRQILADSKDSLLLVEFYADWCEPCRKLAPILDGLAERYRGQVRVFRVDIDVHRELARRYRVRGIPYTVLIRNREVVDTVFGLQPAKRYRKMIDRQLS